MAIFLQHINRGSQSYFCGEGRKVTEKPPPLEVGLTDRGTSSIGREQAHVLLCSSLELAEMET